MGQWQMITKTFLEMYWCWCHMVSKNLSKNNLNIVTKVIYIYFFPYTFITFHCDFIGFHELINIMFFGEFFSRYDVRSLEIHAPKKHQHDDSVTLSFVNLTTVTFSVHKCWNNTNWTPANDISTIVLCNCYLLKADVKVKKVQTGRITRNLILPGYMWRLCAE